MNEWKTIADMRREYGELSLSEESIQECPIEQFKLWFDEVAQVEKSDPTAMVLATVDEKGHPDTRVVLLKGLEKGAFVFYTNYESNKSRQLAHHPYAALNFYWPQLVRQVRVRGHVERVSEQQSDDYFASRPRNSQLSAIASPQSQKIANRAVLEQVLNHLIAQSNDKIERPHNWGGFQLIASEIEFWQGRDNRLHDRIVYYRNHDHWLHHRLAP